MIPGAVTVTVARHVPEEYRYGATVSFDGRPVTRTCNHLHHSLKAAARCVATVEAEEALWAGAPANVVAKAWGDPDGADVYEQTRNDFWGDGRVRQTLRRFTFVDEDAATLELLADFGIEPTVAHRATMAGLILRDGLTRTRSLMHTIHDPGPVLIGKVRQAWRPSAMGGA